MERRRVVAAALLWSALVMVGLAVLLWERAGSVVATVLVVAGVLDLVLSLFFFRSSMNKDQ